jgi:hypothetical protein
MNKTAIAIKKIYVRFRLVLQYFGRICINMFAIIERIIIQFLLNCCPHLQCLGFYNLCCAKDFNEWQQIAKFLSKKIINFSINNVLFVALNNGNIDFITE